MRGNKSLKKIILTNSLAVCSVLLVLLLIVVNTILPHYFYNTQKNMNTDISESINDNISGVLSDINYISTELMQNDELIRDIIKLKTAYADNKYSQIQESSDDISDVLSDTAFLHKNVIKSIVISDNGERLSGEYSKGVKEIISRNYGKPYFTYYTGEDKIKYYGLFKPFYDIKGSYVCDMLFLLSDEKNNMISNQASFAIIERSCVMLSNCSDVFEGDEFTRLIGQHGEESDLSEVHSINGQKYFITLSTIKDFSWKLCVARSSETFYNCIRRINTINIGVFCIIALLICLYINRFSEIISGEISDVSYEINSFLNKNEIKPRTIHKSVFSDAIKKLLRGKNFYYKFLFFNITSILVPVLVLMTVSGMYYTVNLRREYIKTAEVLADMNRFKIESVFEKYNNAANTILINEDVKRNIYDYQILKKTDGSKESLDECYKKIDNELKKIYRYSGDFRFFHNDKNGENIFRWLSHDSGDYDTTAFSSIFETTFDNIRGKYICSITKKILFSDNKYSGMIGYGTLQFDNDMLINGLTVSESGVQFYIVNKNEIVSAASDTHTVGRELEYKKTNVYIDRHIKNYNVSLIMSSRFDFVYDVYMMIVMLFLAIFAFLTAFVLINSYRMSRYIIKPIRIIEKSIGDTNVNYIVKGVKTSDEFDELMDKVNSMKIRIDDLIKRVYEQEIVSKDLQMEALRAQITPHFLYNVFEIINAMIDLGDERVSRLIILLSDFFRQGISRSEKAVSLREEIKYLNVYTDIQKFLLEDRMEFVQKTDEECLDSIVLRFILQPIFENIFKHGMIKSKSIKIKFKAYCINSGNRKIIKILIRDNGKGMDRETLCRLCEYISGEENGLTGSGIRNVNERLILQHGKEYGIKLYSKQNEGTAVVIKIPYSRPNSIDGSF